MLRKLFRTCYGVFTHALQEVRDFPYRSPVPVHSRQPVRPRGTQTPGGQEAEPLWTQRVGNGGVRPLLLDLSLLVCDQLPGLDAVVLHSSD